MKSLGRRVFRCSCGHEADRDANAAVNLFWYPEGRENRASNDATRVEIGDQAVEQSMRPVPVVETRMVTVHAAFA